MIATKLLAELNLGESRSWRDKLNRWLDPQVGRWISEDPIGFAGGDANVYRYVGNEAPVGHDPAGLWTIGFAIGFDFSFGPINVGFQVEGHVGYDPGGGGLSAGFGGTSSVGVGAHVPGLGGAAGGGLSIIVTNADKVGDLAGFSESYGIGGTYSGNYINGAGYQGVEIGIPGLSPGWGLGLYGRGNNTCFWILR